MIRHCETPMPRDTALCLARLLNYNWQDEARDYEENGSDNHIFTDMLELEEWLTSSGLVEDDER